MDNNQLTFRANLRGRLRNTQFSLTHGLLPVYEAVVNSIHAIEEASLSMDDGRITVEILRKPSQTELDLDSTKPKPGPEPHDDIIGFKIVDNGIGFTETNILSFMTLDTDHKVAKGCRGIGRILWLKAFDRVRVESTYRSGDGTLRRRIFTFDPSSGVSNHKDDDERANTTPSTTVILDGFIARYRQHTLKSAETIAMSILDHCLWYFIRPGSAPNIAIIDNGTAVSLVSMFEKHMHSHAVSEQVTLKSQVFELTHVKRRASSLATHTVALCADSRVVTEDKIVGDLPGLYGRLKDDKGEFIYSCYVTSSYLDKSVSPSRTSFDLSADVAGLLEDQEISFSELRGTVLGKVKVHLGSSLDAKIQQSQERVASFTATVKPCYKPILSYIAPETFNIDPEITDRDLDLTLHKQLFAIESQLLVDGHTIMGPKQGETEKEYRARLDDYLKRVVDLKKSDLANYVTHRRVILDLLEKAIQRGADNKYVREELIHELIMPMRVESAEIMSDTSNLWLIDERLAFHHYLASDKSIVSMPITQSGDRKEPDILALSVFDNPLLVNDGQDLPLATIVVVEIKRPMRDDAGPGEDEDPVEQAIGYLNRIRKGQVQTRHGRPIPNSEEIPGFCYVLADLTPSFAERCINHHDFYRTADKLGFFGYKKNSNAYVEVSSFDRVVKAAKERNRVFFDKLGLPAK